MGEIADSMINGRLCHCCGVYLEPGEKVYLVSNGNEVSMPKSGKEFGVPVHCRDCKN